MKLVLAGTEYSVEDSLQKATLADLYHLKLTTGIGMKTLNDSLAAMGDLEDPQAFLDDERILLALNALVWLARRRAGEKLTVDEANDIALTDVSFAADPDDAVEESTAPDPT